MLLRRLTLNHSGICGCQGIGPGLPISVRDARRTSSILSKGFNMVVGAGLTESVDSLTRLRESKSEFENSERESGREAGAKWARESADAGDLYRLTRHFTDDSVATAQQIADCIGGDPEPIFGDDGSGLTEFYCGGFVAGALETYREL